jgi:Tfp pilus assembly protein PilP
MRSRRKIQLGVALGLGGALLAVGVGRAQAPAGPAPASEPAAGAAPASDPTLQRPAAPGLGAVKDIVGGAVKDAVTGGAAPADTAAPAAPSSDPAARAAGLRRKTLREQDFVDNDESNRDPFKSFLRLFVERSAVKVRQVPAIFEKFTLEELTLIAVVSGDSRPRAMFRDPAGLGQTIKRGDYLSKAGARVTKILSDRVIVELSETTASGEARPSRRPSSSIRKRRPRNDDGEFQDRRSRCG